jgi:hypothetical protein
METVNHDIGLMPYVVSMKPGAGHMSRIENQFDAVFVANLSNLFVSPGISAHTDKN